MILFNWRHSGMSTLFALSIVALGALELRGADASPDSTAIESIEVGTPTRIEVFPQRVVLDSPRRESHLIVTGFYGDDEVRDLTQAAEFIPDDTACVEFVDGRQQPIGNGTTSIVARVAGLQLSVPIEVTNQTEPDPVSFRYGTQVALTKQGCNSGACHGSPSGKGGFRLSLRAYDPVLDIETLVREAFNRRTNVAQPEASLLLRKPTLALAHGGGRRMNQEDPAYAILRDWIAEGLNDDPSDFVACTGIEVYPQRRILHRPAHTQQLVAIAHFADGTVRDVTRIASFSSSDEAVASVDAIGHVEGHEKGESAILVQFLEHAATSHLMFLKDEEGFAWELPPSDHFVDQHVDAKLMRLQIPPSDRCSDEEFLRRIYLDLCGILPTIDETLAFLDDGSPDKREHLIDDLLERPEFADHWALRWGDLLRVNNKKVTAEGVHKYRAWIVAAIRDNMPYDQFARELLTASGSTFDNPPANYYRTAADTNDCTETTAQLFLGIRIQCAKCHNHPFERWTQDNYYGIGAFFNRIQRKTTNQSNEMVVWVARAGEVTQPRTGQTMAPWLPLQGTATPDAEADRRDVFVDWLISPENPFFARAEVNRTWGYLMGRGIVEPVDDFRASNPPSNEELLNGLAEHFAETGYDRKDLIRTITTSRTYQASAETNELNRDDERYFSHAASRMLPAEQLLDAICQVTGVVESFAGLPSGTRATQLPSPDIEHGFLKVFGQPAREMACACERSDDSNLSQALQMINGELVHKKLTDESNRLRAIAEKADDEIVAELYLAALCRRPTKAETDTAVAHIAKQDDRMAGLEDVCWAILNSKEFLFQH